MVTSAARSVRSESRARRPSTDSSRSDVAASRDSTCDAITGTSTAEATHRPRRETPAVAELRAPALTQPASASQNAMQAASATSHVIKSGITRAICPSDEASTPAAPTPPVMRKTAMKHTVRRATTMDRSVRPCAASMGVICCSRSRESTS